jgi:hypothetical protein
MTAGLNVDSLVDPREASPMDYRPSMVNEDRITDAITLARNLRNNGASLESIASRLARRGFDKPSIDAVLRKLPAEAPDNIIVRPDRSTGGRLVLIIAGLTIFGVGAVFAVVGRGARAPMLWILGIALLIAGGALMAAGRS